MVTFEKMKAEADKVIKEKNDKLKESDDWKKSQEMQGKWIDTIKRQQEAVMKKKWTSFGCLIVICVEFISWKQLQSTGTCLDIWMCFKLVNYFMCINILYIMIILKHV